MSSANMSYLHCDGSIRRSPGYDRRRDGRDAIGAALCYGMELTGLKRDFGGQFAFMGGVDTQSLIEARRRMRGCVDAEDFGDS